MTTNAQMLNRAAILAMSQQLDVLDTHLHNLAQQTPTTRTRSLISQYEEQRTELLEQMLMCEEVGAEMAEAEEIEPTISTALAGAIDAAVERGGILISSARRMGRELVALVPGCEERTDDATIYSVRVAEGELRLTLLDGYSKGALVFRRGM